MSATKEVFSALPILLRSTTPVASEKVLIWHQKMQEEEPLPPERDQEQSEPDTTPPDHHAWQPEPFIPPNHTHAPVARSDSSPNSAKILEDLAASKSGVDYAGVAEVEEIESNIQERSQRAPSRRSSIHAKSVNHDAQPTPSRAPKHLSQDTVPSFGNLDATAFERAPSIAATPVGPPVGLQTPQIAIETPSENSRAHSRHSRAPSRASQFIAQSVRDDDTETVKDDARTVPVETVAPSHKSRSVASHLPSEHATPSVRAKSRNDVLSPPPASVRSQHTARSGASLHPSHMRLPPSSEGSGFEPTPTQRTVPLNGPSAYAHSHRGSNYAPSHHAPSHHAPSQHGPSKAPTVASRAPTNKEPSQAPSNNGNGVEATPSGDKRKTSLHPLSNYPSMMPPAYGSQYGGSRYAVSNQGETPRALHPLTQHFQMHGPGSQHSYTRMGPMDAQYADEYIHAAVRGRAMAVSPTPSNPHGLPPPPITAPFAYNHPHGHTYIHEYGMEHAMTGGDRPMTPEPFTDEEKRILDEVYEEQLRTPRTSYTVTPTALAAEVTRSHFHDEDICILLHAADQSDHELVRKVIRKAIRNRMKKLQMKHENDKLQHYASPGSQRYSIQEAHVPPPQPMVIPQQDQPPAWAKDMMMIMQETRSRLEELERKKRSTRSYAPTESAMDNEGTIRPTRNQRNGASVTNDVDDSSPITVTLPMHTPAGRSGTVVEESVLHPGATEFAHPETENGHTIHQSEPPMESSAHAPSQAGDEYMEEYENGSRLRESADTPPAPDGEVTAGQEELNDALDAERDESPGQQFLREEIYKLRVKPARSEHSHRTWEIQQEDEPSQQPVTAESEAMPEIPDTEGTVSEMPQYIQRKSSPELPALPVEHGASAIQGYGADWQTTEPPPPPPWQRIHQRLLNWAIVWPLSELDHALNSTMRGHQVDEVALSIWSTQTYKRYVRARLTEHPPMRVDRLFIPPNVADAINSAVYNGRHGDACGMLRDMWTPFGLDGMPRLLLVLCKHRREENHWVAHRFSLPDGTLTTYDTYPERSLPDGRPLGWWFAIRIAWPHAMYPSPDHLAQRMVRIHRPMQLGVDNSVATAGIWRNLLMGSKAERSIDLERLRDLINTEVKNLRQRKDMGKLSITAPRPNWEDMP